MFCPYCGCLTLQKDTGIIFDSNTVYSCFNCKVYVEINHKGSWVTR